LLANLVWLPFRQTDRRGDQYNAESEESYPQEVSYHCHC